MSPAVDKSKAENAKELKADLETKKENLETEIARLGEEKSDEEGVKATNEEDLTDETDYRKKITPDCDWIIGAFKEREMKRDAEMAGLTTAKGHLVTSTTEIVQNSLLQDVALSTEHMESALTTGTESLHEQTKNTLAQEWCWLLALTTLLWYTSPFDGVSMADKCGIDPRDRRAHV